MGNIKEKTRTLGVPLTDEEMKALDALKRQGMQKGHWVAQAIREKLEREGYLDRTEQEEE